MTTMTTTPITILTLSLALASSITPVNAFIDNNNRRHSRTSRIIGGIIAGVAILLILLACCIARRRRMRAFNSGPIIGAGPTPTGFGGAGKPGLFGAGRWGNKHNDNLNHNNQGYGGGGGYQQGGGGYYPGGGAGAAQSPPPYNNETRPQAQAQGYDAAPAQGQYAAPPGPPPQAHLNQPDQHQPFVGGFRT
ncbi:hypothetical protein R3P38DRAFT_2797573 [Favolaschia claudopus]|uniref:Uncharacterized protein n=1 Tax=Favolaschia claudopus TaxID=2862362 RepID=A0AAW0A3L7_9AGAR